MYCVALCWCWVVLHHTVQPVNLVLWRAPFLVSVCMYSEFKLSWKSKKQGSFFVVSVIRKGPQFILGDLWWSRNQYTGSCCCWSLKSSSICWISCILFPRSHCIFIQCSITKFWKKNKRSIKCGWIWNMKDTSIYWSQWPSWLRLVCFGLYQKFYFHFFTERITQENVFVASTLSKIIKSTVIKKSIHMLCRPVFP